MPILLPAIDPARVESARRAAGYRRIYDVVKRKGLDFRTVSAYETPGKVPSQPSLSTLFQLAAVYRCNIQTFFGDNLLTIPPELPNVSEMHGQVPA